MYFNINMDYDDVFDRSEARILIDDLIRGDTTITLALIKNKIIDLEKELTVYKKSFSEIQQHNNKLSLLIEHNCVECDECGNVMFF